MTSPQSNNGLLMRYGRWLMRWRWVAVIVSILATVGIGSGASGLFFDTNYRAFFSDENPQLTAFEALQNIYTKNDNILFVLDPGDRNAFDPSILAAVEDLTADAWTLPFVIRVDAVTNFQHTEAMEDDLLVADLVEGATALSADQLSKARDVALEEPTLARRLVNDDGSVLGVNATLQFRGDDAAEVTGAVAEARALATRIEEDHGVRVHLTGVAMLNNAFMEISQSEMATLMPLMFGAMFLVMVFSLRSVSGTVATLTLVGLSVVVAMGMAGFFRVGLTPPSGQAPVIIMTLAIADSIHILVSMFKAMESGMSKEDAILESLRVNFSPVLLTSVSTVIGFLSLNFSDVPPFNHLGNITAVGVTAAFVFSVFFLPAFMRILPVRERKPRDVKNPLRRLADAVVVYRRPLLWGSTAAVIGTTLFIPANELDDRFVDYFDQTIAFRQDTDFATENLTGIYQIEFSLGGGEPGSISDPGYLQVADAFAEWYREQPGVVHVATYTDVMKRLNKNMHGDDPAYYSLPDSRELAAQYLLLYEMSLPFGLDLNNQINVDKSATRFTVTVEDLATTQIRELTEQGEAWLAANAPTAMQSVGSGPMVMFSYISGINIRSMLMGSVLALILISVLMIFALKSWRLGLLSFVPNLVPAAMAFGFWGMTTGVVNLGLSVVIGVSLGIVVDDSIHFLSKYLRARREEGLDSADAVRYAFETVGTAMVVTTSILVIGFGILATSAFDMNASMGKMTAITLAIALIADLLFLPPLLMAIDRIGQRRAPASAALGLVLLGLFAGASALNAQTAEEQGRTIATEADLRDTGFVDQEAILTMTLRNAHGEESTRQMRSRSLEVENDGDKTLVIFDEPRDVQGTAFLNFTHKTGNDDQWLYLPALRRVKRISSSNKSGPFMGSEFAYEDISSQEVEKYEYEFIREESLDGQQTWVVARYPVDPKSGYTKQLVWYDQAEYRQLKVEFFDKKEELLKTLINSDFRQYEGQFWRPHRMEMVNHQTGKSTTLLWGEYALGNGFSDRDFDQNALRRVR